MRRMTWLLAMALPAATEEPLVPGLLASVADRRHRVELRMPAPHFHLAAGESLHPSLEPAFEVEYTGLVSIVQAGDYSFQPGAAELAIDGRPVGSKPVRLVAGRYPIRIRYRRTSAGPATLLLSWSGPQFAPEPMPRSVFLHPKREPEAGERGRLLVEELGCVNCHASGSASLEGRQGPDLAGIGARAEGRWIHAWLANPKAFRPGAVMPALAGEQERRDVATYLASLRTPAPAPLGRKPSRSDVARGNQLYGAIGCASCHQQEDLRLDGLGSKAGVAALAEYLKDPAKFDPGGRMPSLGLSDQEALEMAAFLADSRDAAFERPFEPGDPARGRQLVESRGCLSCHALAAHQNRQQAPQLDQLSPERSCPHYRLEGEPRDAVVAFLSSRQRHPDVSPAPIHQLARRVGQLRCLACHGSAQGAPDLLEAGAKLRTVWLEQALTGPARARPYQDLRMPHYDPRHARSLAPAFAKAAGVEPGDGAGAPSLAEAHRKRGAGMLGADAAQGGLACVGCHDWGRHQSLGEEGPQLINTTQRLRYDWFSRWMWNPARILSGTSMPAYFSSLDRRRGQDSIDSLWAALAAGERLPLPAGLEIRQAEAGSEARPLPEREAMVIRWDMPEATPAAIAVGLPGGVSYCFDAGESRLRYAWKGGFVDMSETLNRKTDASRLTPTARILGEIFFRSEGFPWRIGEPERVPRPRFRGYRIVAGHPEFHYQLDGIDVWERIVATPAKDGILRQLRLSSVDGPMWFLDGGRRQVPRGTEVRLEVTHR